MELVLETGAGLPNANTYATLETGDAYWLARGSPAAWTDAKASATLTLSAQPTAGDFVVIDGVAYTFTSSLSSTYDVKIGATLSATILNLACAINGGPGDGVRFWSGTPAHSSVAVTTSPTDSVLTVEAKVGGILGNEFETDASLTEPFNGWNSTTLKGGKDSRAQALVNATAYVDDYMRGRVSGTPRSEAQALVLPRYSLFDANGNSVDDATAFGVVGSVVCELALIDAQSPLAPTETTTAAIKRERKKVGTLETDVEYAGSKPGSDTRDFSNALAPLARIMQRSDSGNVAYFERC